jgi:hypothetical protein
VPQLASKLFVSGITLLLFAALGGDNAIGGAPLKHQKVASAPSVQLPLIAKVRGPTTPHDFDLSLLIPRGTRLRRVWFIHGGREADQVLVEWVRSGIVSLYSMDFPMDTRWGLTLWTQTPRERIGFQVPWKGVAIPLLRFPPGSPNIRVTFADVTSDRHPDLLVEQYPGTNHGCGPHQIVATRPDRTTWRIFRSWMCETTLRGSKGLLALDVPYYMPGDSVCCWSKVEKIRLRWNGMRYTAISDVIVPARR